MCFIWTSVNAFYVKSCILSCILFFKSSTFPHVIKVKLGPMEAHCQMKDKILANNLLNRNCFQELSGDSFNDIVN